MVWTLGLNALAICSLWILLVQTVTGQCPAGFTGPSCREEIDECASNPCRNGATCMDFISGYQCICAPGFSGPRCEEGIVYCAQMLCQNGGTCIEVPGGSACVCRPDWTGFDCAEPIERRSHTMSVKLISYQNVEGRTRLDSCCDADVPGGTCSTTNSCDTFLDICADDYNGNDNPSDCRLGRAITGVLSNTNSYQFGSSINGAANPFLFSYTSAWKGEAMIKMMAWDDDTVEYGEPQNIDFLMTRFSYYPAGPDSRHAPPTRITVQNKTRLDFEVRVYCNPNWYAPDCSAYCVPEDNTNGHYDCNLQTGAKMCHEGWDGENCHLRIDYCRSSPCSSPGGKCIDRPGGYDCQCLPGYAGVHCEVDIDECASEPCQNFGTCVDAIAGYKCLCRAGFTGTHCEVNIDDCMVNQCLNGGSCKDQVNGFSCTCRLGFTGSRCEHNTDDCVGNPCRGNHICVDQINAYTCACLPGWTGTQCETSVDDCEAAPCKNGGNCVDLHMDFRCECSHGFYGDRCELRYQFCIDQPCVNGGVCNELADGYSCTCPEMFSGTNCESSASGGRLYVELRSFINSRGLTADRKCCDAIGTRCFTNGCDHMFQVCVDGYDGSSDVEECSMGTMLTDFRANSNSVTAFGKSIGSTSNPLSFPFVSPWKGGAKLKVFVWDYDGSATQREAVDYVWGRFKVPGANHRGRHTIADIQMTNSTTLAVTAWAECNPSWYGPTCSVFCEAQHDDDNGHYTCEPNRGHVVCIPGYTGDSCKVNIDECASNPCRGNHRCQDKVNGYTCECLDGWTGAECETSINDCVGVTCGNGGRCEDLHGSYRCVCPSDRYGDQCQFEYKFCLNNPCGNGGTCTELEDGYSCSCAPSFTGGDCKMTVRGGMLYIRLTSFENPSDMTAAGHCCDGVGTSNCPRQDCDHFFVVCPDNEGGSDDIDECALGQQITDKTWNNNFLTFKDRIGKKTANPLAFQIPAGWEGSSRLKIQVRDFDGSLQHWDLVENHEKDVQTTVGAWSAGLNWYNVSFSGSTGLSAQMAARCNKHWHGESCDVFCEPSDNDDGHYTCDVATGNKICIAGYKGEDCKKDIDDCASRPCRGNHHCVDKINSHSCECLDGWTGANCETSVNDCAGVTCANGGRCEDLHGTYRCVCPSNRYGDQCQFEYKFCLNNPCGNGGTCTELEDGYSCSCAPSFTGGDCEMTVQGGMLYVRLTSFENPTDMTAAGHCCDGVGTSNCPRQDCDHFFVVCPDKEGGSDDTDECALGQQTTDKTWNNNFLTFKDRIGKKTANPLAFQLPSGWKGRSNVKIQVRDFDGSLQHWDLVENHEKDVNIDMGAWSAGLNWYNVSFSGSTKLSAQMAARCNKHWHGANCDVFCEPSDNDDGHYTCDVATGDKICIAGYSGEECKVDNDECASRPCRGNHYCVDKVNGHSCECLDGWTGSDCETSVNDCAGVTCANGGRCEDLHGAYRCVCPTGRYGDQCQFEYNYCQDNPCDNGGTCKEEKDGYSCSCAPSFTGGDCEMTVEGGMLYVRFTSFENPTDMTAEGHCCDGVGTSNCPRQDCDHFFVVCPDKEGGSDNIDECALGQQTTDKAWNNNFLTFKDRIGKKTANPLAFQLPAGWKGSAKLKVQVRDFDGSLQRWDLVENHGESMNMAVGSWLSKLQWFNVTFRGDTTLKMEMAARCNKYWHGTDCNLFCKPTDDDTGHYGCDEDTGRKLCHAGWSGDICAQDIDECASKPCQNGGTCTDLVDGYSCACAIGFVGTNCEVNVQECASSPCQNGATCSDLVNSYQCICAGGYTGVHCETELDECVSNPCKGSTNCVDKVNGYECACIEGWTGKDCETHINDCTGVTCPGGARCEDLHKGYRCVCPADRYGEQCEWEYKYCREKPCLNGGTCTEQAQGYTCTCPEPYTGERCQATVSGGMFYVQLVNFENPTDMTAAGHCCDSAVTSNCRREDCDHFFVVCPDNVGGSDNIDDCALGQQVTDKTWNNNFLQFGKRIGKKTENPLAFSIPAGWKGEARVKMQVRDFDGTWERWDLVENHGQDVQVTLSGWWDSLCWTEYEMRGMTNMTFRVAASCNRDWFGVNCDTFCQPHDDPEGHYDCDRQTGSRLCHPGWEGDHCNVDTDECASDPCQNGATCNDAINGYHCTCAPGYKGVHCKTNIDECASDPCQNGATCQDGINGYTCTCAAGYEGTHCETNTDECASDPCQNGATCNDHVNHYTCTCAAGYEGIHCEIDTDECASSPCQNDATCNDQVNGYTCDCSAGYEGTHCVTDTDECASDPCQNGATCNDQVNGYTCTCAAGYQGVHCETDTDECDSDPCQNGATCTDEVDGYTCTCAPGYADTHCERNLDECASQPCQNGATCQDGINQYECECAAGYEGINCETDTDECASGPCQNGASCTDQVDGYFCTCAAGYADSHCERNIDECASVPCQNGATCKDEINGYSCTCVAGYEGTHCETNTDECESDPCQNGATCNDDVNHYTCTCVAGYEGVHCEVDTNECASDPCQNEATCNDQVNGYSCTCAAGYEGTQCETDTHECGSDPCQNGATCNDYVNHYTCTCLDGYEGTHCETNTDECASDPCQNGATCNDHVNGYTCKCSVGYEGIHCETDTDECLSDPCQKGATCNDHVNRYTCTCVAGYVGVHCEIDTDECASDPCQNGATCNDHVNHYTCTCAAGYAGIHCEENIDECASDPCQNGASCTDQVNGYVCTCAAGYTGIHCETDIDECANDPCQNGATCNDHVNRYICTCADGYEGIHCETDTDECASNPCQNGATCNDQVNGYTCDCSAGYEGTHCETDTDECGSDPCQNGATCNDQVNGYTCDCSAGYEGTHCETDTDECGSDPCQNGATCNDQVNGYTCTCAAGYEDVHCEIDTDECASDPCQNGGTCTDEVNGYVCACTAGYTGLDCEINIDECSSDPCQNGATCEDQVNMYVCHCVPGFVGTHCETNVDECASDPCRGNQRCVDKINGYECPCLPGWEGAQCEIDIDDCAGAPCPEGSTCEDELNGYKCLCPETRYGDHCEHEVRFCLSAPCKNDGWCSESPDGFSCTCTPAFTGPTCEVSLSGGTMSLEFTRYKNKQGTSADGECCDGKGPSCQFNGCDHYFDICVGEYGSGDVEDGCFLGKYRTDTVWNSDNITNFGSAIGDSPNPVLFPFDAPWTGGARVSVQVWDDDGRETNRDFVEDLATKFKIGAANVNAKPVTARVSLQGRTRLKMKVTVYCNPNWYSDRCDVFCQPRDDKTGHYECDVNTGDKICHPGWTGYNCEENINECASSPCVTCGGVCVDLINSYRCDCRPGFIGIHCERDIDECDNNPCPAGATCKNFDGGFLCDYQSNMADATCSTSNRYVEADEGSGYVPFL